MMQFAHFGITLLCTAPTVFGLYYRIQNKSNIALNDGFKKTEETIFSKLSDVKPVSTKFIIVL